MKRIATLVVGRDIKAIIEVPFYDEEGNRHVLYEPEYYHPEDKEWLLGRKQ